MKELSIEQKAERFDDALVRAKQALKEGTITNTAIAYIQDIFPELKESEDEDEKTRKELIELIGCMHDADPRKKGWLAWLEKQGEKKPTDEEMKELLRTEYEKGRADAIAETQVAWSEEDEKQARQIERIVHNNGCTQKLQKQIADWLKSLKDKAQPKQEWDEDDIYMLEQAIKCVNNSEKLEVSTEDIEEWLKALGIRMANKQ